MMSSTIQFIHDVDIVPSVGRVKNMQDRILDFISDKALDMNFENRVRLHNFVNSELEALNKHSDSSGVFPYTLEEKLDNEDLTCSIKNNKGFSVMSYKLINPSSNVKCDVSYSLDYKNTKLHPLLKKMLSNYMSYKLSRYNGYDELLILWIKDDLKDICHVSDICNQYDWPVFFSYHFNGVDRYDLCIQETEYKDFDGPVLFTATAILSRKEGMK